MSLLRNRVLKTLNTVFREKKFQIVSFMSSKLIFKKVYFEE